LDITKIDFTKLGEKVRFLRQGHGWSLVDLAEHSGVSKAYLSDLENGAAGKPNIQYMYAIAVALEVTLDELLQEATARPQRRKDKRASEDLPPGLAELQQELNLSDDDVEMLAQVNFRGNRPKDAAGWRFLWETIKLLGQRNPQK
jgi:transcriptional regulator with XRE-family HTH domain